MTKIVHRQRYPLGLLLFALALAVYKAVMLSVGAADAWSARALYIGLDLFYLSFLLLLATLFGFTKPRIFRIICGC